MIIVIRFLILLIIYFSLIASVAYGQKDHILLQRLSVNDGLSQATVHDVFQDNDGFLWVGTENGVNLYDGYRFRVLPGPNESFEQNAVYKTIQDSQGLLWMIAANGLYNYDKKTDQFQHVLLSAPENENYYIHDIVNGDNGDIWIASSKTLLKYDPKNKTAHTFINFSAELGKDKRINEIFYFDQNIYIATQIGIFVVDTRNKQWKKLPSINNTQITKQPELDNIFNVFVSGNKQLYIGSYSGVYRIDVSNIDSFLAGDGEIKQYNLVDENIDSWHFYPHEDALYIGSYSGLSKIDLNTNSVEQILAFNDVFDDINNNIIGTVFIDQQGVFWLGSPVTGIYKWDPKLSYVKNIRYKKSAQNALSDNVIWAIETSKVDSNRLWVATEYGFNLVNLQTGFIEQFLSETKSKGVYTENYITQLQEDNAQQLWLLTAKGIKTFDARSKQFITPNFPEELLAEFAKDHFAIFLDKEDHLWTLSAEKFRRINTKTGAVDELLELETDFPDSDIYNMLGFLPNSTKMLLSTNKALISFDVVSRKSEFIYQHPTVVESDYAYIDSWLIDDQNILWLAFTAKGLVGLDAKTYQQKYFYNKQNGQIDHNVYGLSKDNDGDLWFSSHNGVYLLNQKTQHIRNFNVSDGLSAREFNANAFENVNNQFFAYGSINGLSLFDPQQLKNKHYQDDITVHATNVDVLSRKIKLPFILNEKEIIKLNYDDVGIRFDFSALTFQHQNILFSYQLAGTSQIVYPDTEDNFITFPSLPSGEHTLSVRIKSPYTGEYSASTKLNIQVSYAPWASPLAYFTYVMIFLLAFVFWLYRKRQMTNQLINAHNQVKYREQRLSLALHGSNSAVWDWQASNNMLFGQRAAEELGFKNLTESYSFDQHIELIHEHDREAFLHQWHTFLAMADLNDNFSCSYRLRTADGEWLWYKDLGKIVDVDNEGHPIRITGSYTNITQSRAEAERAQYYGEAFKQTKDWVLIISDNFTRIMVNDSLKEAFGWQDQEFSFDANVFGLDAQRMTFYQKLFKTLNEDDHWRGEELIKAKSGEEYHVLLNINVSMNKTTNTLHYVCIFTDITAQKNAEKELRYLANYDHLTDLPNRTLLLERIKHGMDYSKRVKKSIALFFIDLDRFKQINDSLGHDYGDLLLKEITSRLTEVLRVDDTVARLGGDEFVILLESFKNNSHLGKIAQKIIEIVGQPIDLNGHVVSVGASIGIALYPEDASNSDELLKNADVAMYHAKQIGRNTFQFFTPRMNVEASQRLNAESNIKNAHDQDKFINHYQPIVDSVSGKAKGVELLMRWQGDDRLIMPGEFISIAEEIGLIIPMTERALERALTDLQVWRQYRPDFFVSINISAIHFSKDYLVRYLTQTLEKFDIPPELLKLEVTESTLIKDPDTVITRMKELTKLGIALALDDFGTGYSSLIYLKKLPLNVLKIDRSFIKGISKDTADEAIVDATLVLAKNLGMKCIAEGVETKEQLTYLAQRDCFAIQGYLYSKPVDNQMITEFLHNDDAELTV